MRHIAWALGAAALVAGCGGGDDNGITAKKGESVESVAARVSKVMFEPGEWQMTTRITAVDMPGAPPELTKAMAGRETVVKHCMTREEAERSPGDLFRKSAEGKCTYERFEMDGGKVDAKMQCQGARPGETMQTEMSGAYSRDTYKTEMKMTVSVPGSEGPMTMEATTEGKRLGACAA